MYQALMWIICFNEMQKKANRNMYNLGVPRQKVVLPQFTRRIVIFQLFGVFC